MVQELADVGVPPEQARMYIQLVRRGSSTATELADLLRISRPQAYRLLEALAHDAYVTASVGRPRMFTAAAPETVLRSLRERTQRSLNHLDNVQGLLATRLEALRQKHADEEAGPQFTVMRGIDAVAKASQDVCRSAGERIDILLAHDASEPLFEAVLDRGVLASKSAEGVGIRVLAPPQARIAVAPAQRRHLDNEPLVTLVLADGRDAVMAISTPAKGARGDDILGVRSNAAQFVATQVLLFNHLWAAGPARLDRGAQ
jgi:sugar-specific transcriptional regulator TrmB